MVAIAQIVDINFPEVLPGEIISGSVTIKNIGDETTSEATGYLGILVKTLWDGQEYTSFTYFALAPDETYNWLFPEIQGGIGLMPDGLAQIEVTSRLWFIETETWRVDDVKSLDLSTGSLIPEPKPLMPLLLIAGLALLLFRRK